MTGQPAKSPNEREVQYWNSAAARAWSQLHDPIDRLFAELTQAALDFADPRPGEHVIDIGCGSGTTVLELAKRVGPNGSVLGGDISAPSIAKAQERIQAAGLTQARAAICDVSIFDFAPESFDLAFSRFGVMFFADPTATFAHLRGAMKRDGRLAFAVFRTPKENPWGTEPVAAVRHLLPPIPQSGPDDPGQFAWANPDRVHRILEGAGFSDVSLTPHDPVIRLAGPGGAAEAADFAMSVGPVVRAMAAGEVKDPQAVRSGLEAFFERHDSPDGIRMPAALWFVSARV